MTIYMLNQTVEKIHMVNQIVENIFTEVKFDDALKN